MIIMAVVTWIVSWLILHFIASILLDVIDAAYSCCILDLDHAIAKGQHRRAAIAQGVLLKAHPTYVLNQCNYTVQPLPALPIQVETVQIQPVQVQPIPASYNYPAQPAQPAQPAMESAMMPAQPAVPMGQPVQPPEPVSPPAPAPSPDPAPRPPEGAQPVAAFCSACGAQNQAGGRFCSQCGKPM